MKYLPTTVCFAAAACLATHGIDGWGWFLFIGVILV